MPLTWWNLNWSRPSTKHEEKELEFELLYRDWHLHIFMGGPVEYFKMFPYSKICHMTSQKNHPVETIAFSKGIQQNKTGRQQK